LQPERCVNFNGIFIWLDLQIWIFFFITCFHLQAISPTSREKLLKAMDSFELPDDEYNSKCIKYNSYISETYMFMPNAFCSYEVLGWMIKILCQPGCP
jgi:hypothetical protein